MIPSELAQGLEGRYDVVRELGAGGMATVYLARDLKHDRDVAIKVLRDEISASLGAERFVKEIAVTARLQHANILPLFESGEAAGRLFYVTPFVDGESLRRRLAGAPLPLDEALMILRDVARALGYAHARGVVHRDIKPENILLAGGAAVVADFGVAKALSASRTEAGPTGATLTSIGTSIGTPAYMAPEQAAGDPATGPGADVYAWGVVAYELLAGRHPFADQVTPQGLMAAHIATQAKSLGQVRPGLPAALAALVMECLAKTAEARPKDGEALAARLAAISSSGETPSMAARRSSVFRIAVPVLVLALAGVAAYAIRGRKSEATAKERTIAVIPFDVGADTANLYVADGLTAELTTKLARIPGLAVRGYTSSKQMRGRPPGDVAKELSVNTILTASMSRSKARLRVNASLIDGGDSRVLWSETFDGEDADQFALQDRLAEAIAGALRVTLTPATRTVLAAGRTNDPAAHDLVQRARFLAERLGDSLSVREAIHMAEEATRRDSTYVDAWVTLANAWIVLADDVVRPSTLIDPVNRALQRALAIAPENAGALAWAGVFNSWYLRDTTTGERYLRRALEVDSSNSVALAVFGINRFELDPDSSARTVARAIRAEAMSSTALQFTLWVPRVFRVFPPDSGELACARFRLLAPVLGQQCRALWLRELGYVAEARTAMRAIDTTALKPNEWAYLAMTAGGVGDTALVKSTIASVERIARTQYVREDAVAIAYSRIGDRENSIKWWQKALDSRSSGVIYASKWPEFAPLRSDARFRALLEGAPIR